jgi:hypothetical protein
MTVANTPGRTTLQLGEPVAHCGIVVAPLFPCLDPRAGYLTLDEALPRGLRVAEVSEAGHVPELRVSNPLDERILLYDGEELVGAKQNRILDFTVLVAAGSELVVPVSCVEQGRWHRVSAGFGAAKHAAHPNLRRRKAETLDSAPLASGLAQGRVWEEVAETAQRLGVHSPTGANADAFRAHAPSLDALEGAFPLEPGQCGAVLALGDTLCLDGVSRPAAFAQLWPKLRRGYLLDALQHVDGPATPSLQLDGFVEVVTGARETRRPSAGLGDDLRLTAAGVVGSGLELDGELLQLSAFTASGQSARPGRIAGPSRRRAA